ncbi:ArgS-related anticodon-binding protein NrtL [Streptomyces djakartensis]|uniref:ArgS-related anticodon-binding protein NrtL n=1 Tax=Streptomyces djakartensis TaxID=68193 RepID=UPI0034DF0218
MTPVELSRTVLHAVRRAVDEGELCVTVPERVVVTPPGPGGCGDYATPVALQLARAAGESPQRVAGILRARLLEERRITDVVVTGPGFLNLRLRGDASADLVAEVLRRGQRYGHVTAPSPSGLLLRCPAEVRAVVVADALARVARSQGHAVRVACDGPVDPQWVTVLGLAAHSAPHAHDGSAAHAHDGSAAHAHDGSAAHAYHGSAAPARHGSAAHAHDGSGAPAHDGSAAHAHDRSAAHPHDDAVAPLRPVPAPADPLPLGRDAARWALLYPAGHDRPRIAGGHLVQRESNPLFRVRYAHARTRALLRNAADLGFHPEPGPLDAPTAPATLLSALRDHPRVLAATVAHRAPDRLARHLVAVADATLPVLPAVLPLGEEKPSAAHRARLALAEAAGTVLAGGLSLLGIDAPEHL